jgi:hypothetical protein
MIIAWVLLTLAWRVTMLRVLESNWRLGMHKFSKNLEWAQNGDI